MSGLILLGMSLCALAGFALRVGWARHWPLGFLLGAAGGVLLLAHSHVAFQLKSGFLVQVTHSTMGALAGLMMAARWLELRLSAPWRGLAGAAASAAMLAIALILVFYREANIVLPPD